MSKTERDKALSKMPWRKPTYSEAEKVREFSQKRIKRFQVLNFIKNICAIIFLINIVMLVYGLISDNEEYILLNVILMIFTGIFILTGLACKKAQKELKEILKGNYLVLLTECEEVLHERIDGAQTLYFIINDGENKYTLTGDLRLHKKYRPGKKILIVKNGNYEYVVDII